MEPATREDRILLGISWTAFMGSFFGGLTLLGPGVKSLFEDIGVALPLPTQVFVELAQFYSKVWPAGPVLWAVGIALICFCRDAKLARRLNAVFTLATVLVCGFITLATVLPMTTLIEGIR